MGTNLFSKSYSDMYNVANSKTNIMNNLIVMPLSMCIYNCSKHILLFALLQLAEPIQNCQLLILAEYAIAEQSEAYPRLTLAKIIIAEQSQAAYPQINSS